MTNLTAARTDDFFQITATDVLEHKIVMDIAPEQGGHNSGFRPMQAVLAALVGCSSADIISILNKQKQKIDALKINIDAERQKNIVPALWEKISLQVYFEGNIEPAKAIRAVQLSIDKYCSVAAMLKKSGTIIDYTIHLNQTLVFPTNTEL